MAGASSTVASAKVRAAASAHVLCRTGGGHVVGRRALTSAEADALSPAACASRCSAPRLPVVQTVLTLSAADGS